MNESDYALLIKKLIEDRVNGSIDVLFFHYIDRSLVIRYSYDSIKFSVTFDRKLFESFEEDDMMADSSAAFIASYFIFKLDSYVHDKIFKNPIDKILKEEVEVKEDAKSNGEGR